MKGQFYSIMITLFIIPILALIVFYSRITVPQNIDTSIRAEELQYFSQSMGEDLVRFLQINGKRAMIAAVSMVITNGKGLNSAQASLAEMIENGTLNGTQPYLDEKNLTIWEKNISDIGASQGFNVSFISSLPLIVTQGDSFDVLFNKTIYVNISDSMTGMYVLKNLSVAADVSIEGIEDPLYSTENYWNVSVIIVKSPFEKNTTLQGTSWNLTNLTSNVKNSFYYSSSIGGSFLDRLEGIPVLSSRYKPYGLESFIYLPNLTSGYRSNTFGVLDYQYWTKTHGYMLSTSQSYNPSLDPIYNSWFRIGRLSNNDYGINQTLNLTS